MRRGLRGLRRRLSDPATLRRAVGEPGRPSIASIRLARARPKADRGEPDDATTVRRGMTAYVGPPSQLFPGLLHFVRIGRRTTAAALCNKRIGQGVHAHAADGPLCCPSRDYDAGDDTVPRRGAHGTHRVQWQSPTRSSRNPPVGVVETGGKRRDLGSASRPSGGDEPRVGGVCDCAPASGRASPGGLALPEPIA